jgi:hypothetical protein
MDDADVYDNAEDYSEESEDDDDDSGELSLDDGAAFLN